jgi:hypothetical protein
MSEREEWIWPHDQRPPQSKDHSRPIEYVTEMTAIGVMLETGPDLVVAAVLRGLSPNEFVTESKFSARDSD